MKQFVFEVTINEGSDEFWEEMRTAPDMGIVEVKRGIEMALTDAGWVDAVITLKKFKFDWEEGD